MNNEIVNHLANLTLDLCRIPSETGHEARIADWMEARCRTVAGEAAVRRIGNSVICDPAAPDDAQEARPVFVFYDKEEGAHEENGLQPVLDSGILSALDFAFVLEPTDGALQLGCTGTLHATVTVHGRRAHSARPWQGENAIYRAIPLLERLKRFERREVRFGELVFYEVMGVTRAQTRNSKNVVPDALLLNVNYRFAPGKSVEMAEAELREMVRGEGIDVDVFDRAPAGEVYLDHPLIEPWRAREGIPLQPKQAWTDIARLTAHGIPAVNFGPGETAQAHQADEWCSVVSLERTYGALWRFFGGEEDRASGSAHS